MHNALSLCFRCAAVCLRKLISKGLLAAFLILISSAQYCLAAISISTVEELQHITDNLTGSYELANDIDAAGSDLTPIGSSCSTPFAGTFDGRGHAVRNLHITGSQYVGLFGCTSGAAIRNLVLDNATVQGNSDTGGIAGANQGTITHSCNTGGILGWGAPGGPLPGGGISLITITGGLTGHNSGTLSFCYNAGAINLLETNAAVAGINAGTISSTYWDNETSGVALASAVLQTPKGYLRHQQRG